MFGVGGGRSRSGVLWRQFWIRIWIQICSGWLFLASSVVSLLQRNIRTTLSPIKEHCWSNVSCWNLHIKGCCCYCLHSSCSSVCNFFTYVPGGLLLWWQCSLALLSAKSLVHTYHTSLLDPFVAIFSRLWRNIVSLPSFSGALAWLLFTLAMDAFTLSPAVAYFWSGLWLRFRPSSLPVFCCWVSTSSRFVMVLLPVFLVRWFGGVVK